MLSCVGGAVGLLLAHLTLGATSALIANQIPRVDEITLDGRVLAFAFVVSLVAGLLAGAMPALRAGRTDLTDALKEGGRSDASVGLRTRRILIVCEVALSLVLLMGAGVLARSLVALRGVDVGFDPDHVLTVRIALPESRYATAARSTAFYDGALARVRALPGVQSAGAVDDLPFQGGSVQYMVADGKPELSTREQPTVQVRKITPGYLQTMRIPLVRGRDLAANDNDVVIVSESAARLLWGEVDPIGHTATLPLQSRERTLTVIGVARDIRDEGLAEDVGAHVYEYSRERDWRGMAIALRTSVPPATLATTVERAIHEIDPNQPIERTQPMTAVVDETIVSQRFSAMLLTLFAAVALLLASVGIYSVLANVVRGRRREIGIRTALGARTTDVLRLVVIEAMTPTIVGIAIGGVAAIACARVLETMVFGISASDPLTLAAVAGVLALVSLLASLGPALRAARLDPLQTLRGN
jgi:predicted permease